MTTLRSTPACLILVAALMLFSTTADAKGKAGKNQLKHEMNYLDTAFNGLIRAIALDDLGPVVDSFARLHELRADTERAFEKGEITLPKNNDKNKLFRQLDDNFHKELEFVLHQAKANDAKAVKASAIRLLDSCIECHRMFRK